MLRIDQEPLKAVVDLAAAGQTQPHISCVLQLEQAVDARYLLEASEKSRGRSVLQVWSAAA